MCFEGRRSWLKWQETIEGGFCLRMTMFLGRVRGDAMSRELLSGVFE